MGKTEKDAKNMTKKNKKVIKKDKTKKEKKESFITGVKKEMKKVRWPLKKEMIKCSIATLSFILFFAIFFTLADLIIAGVKVLVA